jgi:hypothetical protein
MPDMTSAAAPLPAPKKSWSTARKLLAGLIGVILVLAFLTFSLSPAVETAAPPASADVIAARAAFDRVRAQAGTGKPVPTFISWREAQGGGLLLGRALGIQRLHTAQATDSATVLASLPIGPLWANVSVTAVPTQDRFPDTTVRIGWLTLPPFVTRPLANLAVFTLNLRGAQLKAPDEMVRGLTVTPAGLTARLNLPKRTRLLRQLNDVQTEPVDPALVANTYCRLSREQAASPSLDLATQVRRAFKERQAGSNADGANRAAFVALAMFTVSPNAGNLAGEAVDMTEPCRIAPQPLMLIGRHDLSKHWTLSAALTALYGQDISQAMGTWKEISDSGPNGSGFSFVDLSADRSGIHWAMKAGDASKAEATRSALTGITEMQIVPLHALALSEGLTEAEFQRRYTSTESQEYAAMVEKIDRVLKGQE